MYFWVKSKVLDTGSSFAAGYQAILDYATGLGFALPTAACQILQNQLYIDIETYIGWAYFRHFACYANDGGDQNFACINWANTGLNVTRVNAPTYTNKQGFSTNGTTQYLECGVLQTSGIESNRHYGLALYSGDQFAIGYGQYGLQSDSWGKFLTGMGATFQSRNMNSTVDNITYTASSRYRIFCRFGTANYRAYTPNIVTVVRPVFGANRATSSLKIGYTVSSYNATAVTVSSEGESMTDAEVTDYKTIIDTYLAAL